MYGRFMKSSTCALRVRRSFNNQHPGTRLQRLQNIAQLQESIRREKGGGGERGRRRRGGGGGRGRGVGGRGARARARLGRQRGTKSRTVKTDVLPARDFTPRGAQKISLRTTRTNLREGGKGRRGEGSGKVLGPILKKLGSALQQGETCKLGLFLRTTQVLAHYGL